MSKGLPETYVQGFHDEKLVQRMEYRVLGKTGLNVSKISLGCATLSHLYGDLDVEEAVQTVQKAIKSGINYIDTAPYYGQGRSEEVLGKALKNVPREAYYIATKVARYEVDYAHMFDFSAKRARESMEKSLERLGLDYVDLIQIHDIDMSDNVDVVLNELLPELEKFVKEGKARFIGVTAYSLSTLKECLQKAPGRFHTVLSFSRYTLLDDSLTAYIDYFKSQNVGIICAAGHALGLLTNAGPQSWHFADEEQQQVCRQAAEICKKANVELGKLAMYYFMQLPDASTFLSGMQNRKLLDINLNAYYDGLTEHEQEVLKQLKSTIFTTRRHWEGVEHAKVMAAKKK